MPFGFKFMIIIFFFFWGGVDIPFEKNPEKLYQLLTYLLGGVHAESVHDVSEEEEVELALAIPIVDVADLDNS